VKVYIHTLRHAGQFQNTTASRSEMMSRIRSKDTKPEIVVRKALHQLGFRFQALPQNLWVMLAVDAGMEAASPRPVG
jgi:hypothetical protein